MLSFTSPTWSSSIHSKSNITVGEHAIHSASLIVPRLYISDLFTAQNASALNRLKVTHILSIIDRVPVFPDNISHIQKLHIHISDTSQDNLLQHLHTTTAFIQAALDESPDAVVLVHCLQGISRSAAVVCAYLIATTNMISSEALDFVREKRPIICPNLGFRKQLEVYASSFYADGRKAPVRYGKIGDGIANRIRRLKSRTSVHGNK